MICENCKKNFDVEKAEKTSLRTGCTSFNTAIICPNCGRLHWDDGSAIFNRQGQLAFVKGGELVNEDPK